MTRRALGVAVLSVALLCSVVVAKADGIRVAGTAALPPGLDAPTVGDCLSSVSGPLATGASTAGPPSPVSIDSVGETAVTFSDCSGDHIGEVVAFRRMQGRSTGINSFADGAASTSDAAASDGEWCQQVAIGYRSHWLYRLRDASIGQWVPSTGQRFIVILSAPSGDPVEPRWAACTVVPPGLEAYRGSYVGSLAQGPAPSPFGLCRSADQADRWVSCVVPHRTQVFGTAGVFETAAGQPSSALQGTAACRALIEGMTGMTDISGGGMLRVDVVGAADDPGTGAATGGAVDEPDKIGTSSEGARCALSVVGDGQLVGTLIGIGRRPLPLM